MLLVSRSIYKDLRVTPKYLRVQRCRVEKEPNYAAELGQLVWPCLLIVLVDRG